jgi:hypothetical protein
MVFLFTLATEEATLPPGAMGVGLRLTAVDAREVVVAVSI